MSLLSIGINLKDVDETVLQSLLNILFNREFKFIKGYVYDKDNDTSSDLLHFPEKIPSMYNNFTYSSNELELNISLINFYKEIGVEININYENLNYRIFNNKLSIEKIENIFMNLCNRIDINYIFADPDENVEYSHSDMIDKLFYMKSFYPILVINNKGKFEVYKSGKSLDGI